MKLNLNSGGARHWHGNRKWVITSAIETVTRDMIQKTWQEIEFRLDVSRATNGAHIEMY